MESANERPGSGAKALARRIRRSSGSLDHRAPATPRAVIDEYVASAPPGGSLALVERYGLGVSSATVRNILAELELSGLLTHPHTSAGRIPTDEGYRWYVESIMESALMPEVEQLMIRHQFGQVEYASEHWFRLAASTIASITRAAGLATPAKPAAAHVPRMDLVSINDRLARRPPRPPRSPAPRAAPPRPSPEPHTSGGWSSSRSTTAWRASSSCSARVPS